MQYFIITTSVVAAFVIGTQSNPASEDIHRFDQLADYIDKAWSEYKIKYAKQYVNSAEELERKRIFSENLKKIEMHNYLYYMNLKSYEMGVNQFTDMSFPEFLKRKTGRIASSSKGLNPSETDFTPIQNFTLPDSVDWRQKGYVTAVKDQGDCGSCWAFGSTGSLEGQQFKKTGKLVSLSEQNLVDCSSKFGNYGCDGGEEVNAFDYIKANGGIDTEKSYPYAGKVGKCRYRPQYKGATVSGYVRVKHTEADLTASIASIGPISVAIHVHEKFQSYKSGIFDEPHCGTQLDHAVLAVGYGSLNGKDYYIVKNSWNTDWGDKGYILMSRNKNNQCGIASDAVYPLV